ncbi:MAG: DUF1905 domain-containing protein [Propionicimonas sp.]|uniref:DUF1905 domain-containing protein n=1 Tax=Propionicimonas sp. TaxID=1955623 RepID=UPI003D11DC96
MELEFTADVIEWRGPAPYYYAVVPVAESDAIGDLAGALTYGWGCIPVEVRLADQRFTTSLFPKDGGYVVPLKAAIRPPGLGAGDRVRLRLGFDIHG